jgi:hypothetical protein
MRLVLGALRAHRAPAAALFLLDLYPPGTLFTVEAEDGTLNFRPGPPG